jgi:hypothetical protein
MHKIVCSDLMCAESSRQLKASLRRSCILPASFVSDAGSLTRGGRLYPSRHSVGLETLSPARDVTFDGSRGDGYSLNAKSEARRILRQLDRGQPRICARAHVTNGWHVTHTGALAHRATLVPFEPMMDDERSAGVSAERLHRARSQPARFASPSQACWRAQRHHWGPGN